MGKIKNLKIILDGKKLVVKRVKFLSFFERFKGLMFSDKNVVNNLFFENTPRNSIHSFFVFYDFLIVWLDKNNNVIGYRRVKPFSFYVKSKKEFHNILEIPISNYNKELLSYFKIDLNTKKSIT